VSISGPFSANPRGVIGTTITAPPVRNVRVLSLESFSRLPRRSLPAAAEAEIRTTRMTKEERQEDRNRTARVCGGTRAEEKTRWFLGNAHTIKLSVSATTIPYEIDALLHTRLKTHQNWYHGLLLFFDSSSSSPPSLPRSTSQLTAAAASSRSYPYTPQRREAKRAGFSMRYI